MPTAINFLFKRPPINTESLGLHVSVRPFTFHVIHSDTITIWCLHTSSIPIHSYIGYNMVPTYSIHYNMLFYRVQYGAYILHSSQNILTLGTIWCQRTPSIPIHSYIGHNMVPTYSIHSNMLLYGVQYSAYSTHLLYTYCNCTGIYY